MNVSTSVATLAERVPVNPAVPATPGLVVASQDVLLQGLGLLFKLFDRNYSRVVAAPYSASIGQHYRHILEHFQCLVRGMRSGEINYDARQRNRRLETEVTYASIATCDILRAIKNYSEAELGRTCKVVNSVSYGSSQPSVIETNVGRELAYCIGHAVHHYAIIRLICSQIELEVPVEFGVAPSTLKYKSTLAAD
jgi:hypothetical protein